MFSRWFSSWLCVSLVLICSSIRAEPSLYIHEPNINAFYVLPQDSNAVNVAVSWQLFDLEPADQENIQVCMQLFDPQQALLGNECMSTDTNSLTLTGLSAGVYPLIFRLKDVSRQQSPDQIEYFSEVRREVNVRAFEDSLPKLQLVSPTTFVVDQGDSSVQVSIQYSLDTTFSTAPLSDLQVCLSLATQDHVAVIDWTCVDPMHTSLNTSPLRHGSYTLIMHLAHRASKRRYISTQLQATISVVNLKEVLPTIQVSSNHLESLYEKGSASVVLDYHLTDSVALSLVQLCLTISRISNNPAEARGEVLLAESCFKEQSNALTISRFPLGLFQADYYLKSKGKTSELAQVFESSRVEVRIETRQLEEFIPTYEWKELHAWNSIPSGIETR